MLHNLMLTWLNIQLECQQLSPRFGCVMLVEANVDSVSEISVT